MKWFQRLKNTSSARTVYDLAAALAVGLSFAGFLLYPSETMAAAKGGLSLCANIIIPSLFPCFVLSSLAVETGVVSLIGRACRPIMRPLFRVPGECAPALALGLAAGYPVGAKTAIAIYGKGLCTRTEAERLLAFSNNTGPAFILGTVGAAIFADARAGLLLYLSHAAASIAVGLVFRFYKAGGEKEEKKARELKTETRLSFPAAFVASMKTALNSILGICSFVVFFAVAIRVLFVTGAIPSLADFVSGLLSPLGVSSVDVENLLTGFIEISSGLWGLRGSGASVSLSLSMAAFMIGWAGISVHCQVLSFIGDANLSMFPYLTGKLLHAVFSSVIAFALSRVFYVDRPVSAIVTDSLDRLVSLDWLSVFLLTLSTAAAVWSVLILYALLRRRRRKA